MDLLKYLKLALSECKDPEVAEHIQAALDTWEKKRLWYTYRSVMRGSGTCVSSAYEWEIRNASGVVAFGVSGLRSDLLEKELNNMIKEISHE